MKIAVRYQSRGGNTKAVAEAIAKLVGVRAKPVSVPLNEPVDLLFVGGGVYAGAIDRTLQDFFASLSPETAKSVAAFSTGGGMSGTQKIAAAAKAKGIDVRDQTLPIKMGIRNYAGIRGGVTLSERHLSSIKDFVSKTASK